jgi:hypoxanthine-guanine phosphoribosyltransferase
VDGDEIILNAAENLCFNLQHPLNLSSVQTNVSKVTIIVEETLSIDNLTGQEVLMNITSGSVTFSPDLVLSIQGKISIGYIHVKSFELQYDSMLTVRKHTPDPNEMTFVDTCHI